MSSVEMFTTLGYGRGSPRRADVGRLQSTRTTLRNGGSTTRIRQVGYDHCQYQTDFCIDVEEEMITTLEDDLARAVRDVDTVSPRVIDRATACCLLHAPDSELPTLLATARQVRRRFHPPVVSYSRKVFLPLTNLCRDYCGYCTFRRDPGQPGAHTMTPDEIMEVVRAGERMGCTEALFSLGDKPELLFPEMRDTLRSLGYKSTLHYLEAMCEKVLRETSLLPHPNPGLMSAEWLQRLARVAPSMGLMLETISARLLAKGAAHDNAPDKEPAKRLRVIEEAGRQRIPFTTGILIGIGETLEERVDTLLAIRDLHEKYGHIQEVIVQNFRAKHGTPMAHWPEPEPNDLLRTLAVARLIMPRMNIQAPPNLSDPRYDDLLDGGINDWGGVSPLTPDFINPEKPWPHLEDLQRRTEAKGFELRQRLPVYPEFIKQAARQSAVLAQRLEGSTDVEGYVRRAA
jgi:FO synthase